MSDNKVTMEIIEAKIVGVNFFNLGEAVRAFNGEGVNTYNMNTTTICVVTMQNGYTIIGKSACVDPLNFNEEVGKQIAYDDALNQIWPLLGYELKENMYKIR